MLVLFETAAGFAIFKVLNEKKLQEVADLTKEFENPDFLSNFIQLEKFTKFVDTKDALASCTELVEGKVSKKLRKLLKKLYVKELRDEVLAVADRKLSTEINKKLQISVVSDSNVQQLMRAIRSQLPVLLPGIPQADLTRMTLGLAHSLNRYKLKCSPDKIDTLIVQSISMLDDLDKEINNYVMRTKEMYGWHFPDLAKIVPDNPTYIKAVKKIGMRHQAAYLDLTDIIPEETIERVREAAIVSLGTELTPADLDVIHDLCQHVEEMEKTRESLRDYLFHRMQAVAPNLCVLAGEVLGARLIAHAGTLVNLAKHPASTIQILGAEKALFRALKTRHQTPKYGLIYHASMVSAADGASKGKIARKLACHIAKAIRVDAFGEDDLAEGATGPTSEFGIMWRAKLEKETNDMKNGKYNPRISGIKRKSFPTPSDAPSFKKMKLETDAGDYPSLLTQQSPRDGGSRMKKIKKEEEDD